MTTVYLLDVFILVMWFTIVLSLYLGSCSWCLSKTSTMAKYWLAKLQQHFCSLHVCFSTFFLDFEIDVYWTMAFTALQFLEFDSEIIQCHNTLVTLAVVQNSIHKTVTEHPHFATRFWKSCWLFFSEPLHTR